MGRFVWRVPLALAPWLLSALPALADGAAKVSCEIRENGQPASGTIAIMAGGREVSGGTCGKPLSIAPGPHEAILRLDGALDGPEVRVRINAQAGKTTPLTGEFTTGFLDVRIQSQGKDTAGIALIRRDGAQIGTLGSGVTAHLSAGTYEVVARYRTRERRFENVSIERDKRTSLSAAF
jgi:hypothetical protein